MLKNQKEVKLEISSIKIADKQGYILRPPELVELDLFDSWVEVNLLRKDLARKYEVSPSRVYFDVREVDAKKG